MAKTFQTQLPAEYETIVEEIRDARAAMMEETSNISIVKDAIKMMHKKICKKNAKA